MTRSVARFLPLALAAASLALGIGAVVFTVVNGPGPNGVAGQVGDADSLLVVLGYGAVGALLARRLPRNVIGWMFCAAALVFALASFANQYALRSLIVEPGSLPGGLWFAWLGSWLLRLA